MSGKLRVVFENARAMTGSWRGVMGKLFAIAKPWLREPRRLVHHENWRGDDAHGRGDVGGAFGLL